MRELKAAMATNANPESEHGILKQTRAGGNGKTVTWNLEANEGEDSDSSSADEDGADWRATAAPGGSSVLQQPMSFSEETGVTKTGASAGDRPAPAPAPTPRPAVRTSFDPLTMSGLVPPGGRQDPQQALVTAAEAREAAAAARVQKQKQAEAALQKQKAAAAAAKAAAPAAASLQLGFNHGITPRQASAATTVATATSRDSATSAVRAKSPASERWRRVASHVESSHTGSDAEFFDSHHHDENSIAAVSPCTGSSSFNRAAAAFSSAVAVGNGASRVNRRARQPKQNLVRGRDLAAEKAAAASHGVSARADGGSGRGNVGSSAGGIVSANDSRFNSVSGGSSNRQLPTSTMRMSRESGPILSPSSSPSSSRAANEQAPSFSPGSGSGSHNTTLGTAFPPPDQRRRRSQPTVTAPPTARPIVKQAVVSPPRIQAPPSSSAEAGTGRTVGGRSDEGDGGGSSEEKVFGTSPDGDGLLSPEEKGMGDESERGDEEEI